MQNTVKVRIVDTVYGIVTEESGEYVEKIARAVDRKIREVLEQNERASVNMATVLACFDFCDESYKAADTADNLRGQLRDYIEEISTVRAENDDMRKELAKLREENKILKLQLDASKRG